MSCRASRVCRVSRSGRVSRGCRVSSRVSVNCRVSRNCRVSSSCRISASCRVSAGPIGAARAAHKEGTQVAGKVGAKRDHRTTRYAGTILAVLTCFRHSHHCTSAEGRPATELLQQHDRNHDPQKLQEPCMTLINPSHAYKKTPTHMTMRNAFSL